MDLFLRGTNKELISSYLLAPSQGLVITAPLGFGKDYVLDYISSRIVGTSIEKLHSNPSYKQVESEKSIGIDEIREIKKFLKLKSNSKVTKRVISIVDCNKMTIEAQSSFLKILEEPPEGTYFLMTAQNTSTLLPTIVSRVRTLELRPYSQDELHEYFVEQGYTSQNIDRAYLMSGGLFKKMLKILDNSIDNTSFDQAKVIISSNHYQRLLLVDALSKDKTQTTELLYSLRRTLLVALHSGNTSENQAKKLHRALIAVNESEQIVTSGSPNLKLLLDDLVLSM